ncbi:MAG: MerR family transcriptional regulator [Anaerolineae bacterium]|nr:MerR family transcriptional regulator [Anaerolineae bacterium]
MYRIGEFSKIAQVPGSVLRYYDQIGLLKPAHIDQWTGYRYYSAKQLPRLHRILALKELGLSLDQITRLVDEEVSAAEVRGMLMLKKAQVEQTLHEELLRLRHIEARLQLFDEPDESAFDIVLKNVPSQHYLSLRSVLPNADAALNVMRGLVEELPPHVADHAPGYFTTVIHSETLESDQLDIELGIVLAEPDDLSVTISDRRVLTTSLLPAVNMMVTVVQVGGFERNCQSYGAIGIWVEENGYLITGPGREVLIQPPRSDLMMDEVVTEIQFPVERRGEQSALG